MGGTLSNIFKGQQSLQNVSPNSSVPLYGAPPSAAPSTGTKVARGAIQGALQGLSQYGTAAQPTAPGPSMPAPGPAPMQVDPSFFSPTNFGRNPSAFYGGGQ
jgi:hypothetical protein